MNTPSESFIACYKCKSVNPQDKKFCGDCGTPLDPTIGLIDAYLDANLANRLDEAIKARFREQQVTEIALAANVLEKVSGWAKLFAILIGLPLTIMGAYLAFVGFDYKNSLDKAKDDINKSIESSKLELDEINKKLKSNQAGAIEIAQQEAVLKEKLNLSSKQLEQLPSLVKKVDTLEVTVAGIGFNAIPLLMKQGKAIGIDVTHLNSSLNWDNLKSAGISFAFIKATQGATGLDPMFNKNWQQAKKAGIIRGAYHFLIGSDITAQAENFIQHVQLELGDLPPTVDFEPNPVGSSATLEDLKLFIKLIKQKTNCTPIIYSGIGNLRSLPGISDDKEISKYPLWLAKYGPSPVPPSPWVSWTFWQFSDGLRIKGLPALDFNGFNGSESELREFVNRSCTWSHT